MLELENPDIWSNPEQAQQLGKEKARLESVVAGIDQSLQTLDDASELLELAVEEDDDLAVGCRRR